MKEGKELYKQAELPAGMDVEPCPVCGADAELWQHSNDFKNGPIDKLIMCSNGDRFGPQDGAMNEGCWPRVVAFTARRATGRNSAIYLWQRPNCYGSNRSSTETGEAK